MDNFISKFNSLTTFRKFSSLEDTKSFFKTINSLMLEDQMKDLSIHKMEKLSFENLSVSEWKIHFLWILATFNGCHLFEHKNYKLAGSTKDLARINTVYSFFKKEITFGSEVESRTNLRNSFNKSVNNFIEFANSHVQNEQFLFSDSLARVFLERSRAAEQFCHMKYKSATSGKLSCLPPKSGPTKVMAQPQKEG